MKIAYLSNSDIPSRSANSVHVMKMCQAFARNGHDVTLFGLDGSQEDLLRNETPYTFYGVEEVFRLRFVLPWRHLGRGWVYSWRLFRAMRALQPDLVYGRNFRACVLAAVMGYPMILELHTMNNLLALHDKLLFLMLRRSGGFRRIVVISMGLKADLLDAMSVDVDRILVAHDGADAVGEHHKPQALKRDSIRLQVGYVGHLYPGRGIELLSELARRLDGMDFHLVGGQPSDIQRVRRLLALPDNVVLHGFLPYVHAEAFRAHCDVLIAPYQHKIRSVGGTDTSRWFSPLKIFEYMAAGKPIVCSDLPVLREILEHGRTAWLVHPDEAAGWVDALRLLAHDLQLRRRLGAAARQEWADNYTWQGRATRILQGVSLRPVRLAGHA